MIAKGTLCLIVRPRGVTVYPQEECYIGRTCTVTGLYRADGYCPTDVSKYPVYAGALRPLAPPPATKTTRKPERVHA